MAPGMGIWNHAEFSRQTQPKVAPMDSAGGNSNSGMSADSATISANDFLTLLVTEMQNQDPTATTDPNEYINQLVNVNSLEQLISINQNLSTALGASASGSSQSNSSTSPGSARNQSTPAALSNIPTSGRAQANMERSATHLNGAIRSAPGNLTIPSTNPAAEQIARALSGQS